MQELIKFHNFHWYTPVWLILFLLCLILLCFAGRSGSGRDSGSWQRGRAAFLPLVPLAMILAYCPLTMKVLVPAFLPSYLEYERLTWLFFEFPLIAFVIISLKNDLKVPEGSGHNLRLKAVRFLLVAGVLFVCFLYSQPDNRRYFIHPENPYKISQEAVDACEIIRKDNDGAPATVCVQIKRSFARQDDLSKESLLFFGMRQYDARYQMRKKIIQPKAYNRPDFSIKAGTLKDFDYYLAPKLKVITKELKRLHFIRIGKTAHYNVFRKEN